MKLRNLLAAAALAVPFAAVADDPGAEDAFAGISEMHAHELTTARGADSNTVIVTSRQDFRSTVQDSEFSVGTMNNGDITLGSGAFENFSGMGVNVLNTGNANGFSVGIGVSVYLQ